MSLLGIKRAIECTNGVLTEIRNGEHFPISKQIKTSRSTKSHFSADNENGVPDNVDTANLQKEEFAQLSNLSQELSLRYNLHIHGLCEVEMADQEEALFIEKLKNGIDSEDIEPAKMALAMGYTYQIISGKTGWRNNDLSLETTTFITIENETLKFNDCNLLPPFKLDSWYCNLPTSYEKSFKILSSYMYNALFNNEKFVMNVEHVYNFGITGVYIYPSQLMLDEKESKDDKFSKKLFFIKYDETLTAAITSQKIQNMIRKIDFEANEGKNISFETYGVDLSSQKAYRTGANRNFYGMKKKIFEDQELSLTEWYFVLGIIIRGGVFGGGLSKAAKKTTKEKE